MGKVKISTVETASFSMDCCRFGSGKKTFVILPGLSVQSVMGFADSVYEAYKVFAEEYTVFLFDRRKDLPETYSIREMAEDTAEALKTLGLEHVSLFGASQGGMIAMEIAVGHPELVGKLVLGSTAASADEERSRTVEDWIGLAESGDREGLYLAFGEAIYPKEMFEVSRDLFTEAAKTVTDEDLHRFVTLARGLKGFDITEELPKISCPVLVLGSEDDRVLGADAPREIIEHLGDRNTAVLYMYDGYGHAAYDTAPDYRERILNFLSSV